MIFIIITSFVIIAAIVLQISPPGSNIKKLEKILPIYRLEKDCLISRQGDITIALELELPEIFTLSTDDYENLHQSWLRAIKILPPGTVVHKQDWYTNTTYKKDKSPHQDFLKKSSEQYFDGRPYRRHQCYLMITRRSLHHKTSTSVFSNLLKPSLVPNAATDPQQFNDFVDKCGQMQRLLSESGLIKSRRLTTDELAGTKETPGLLERYCFLLSPDARPQINDIEFKPEWKIGHNFLQLFSLSDAEDLPSVCGSRITYDKYSTDKTKFSIGFAASTGLLLSHNHIYNQVILIEDTGKTIRRLEAKGRRLQSLSAYSRENAISRDATNAFLNECISQQRLPVKAHFNIMSWTDDHAQLKEMRNSTSAAIAQMDATPRQEIKGAPQLFWSCLPGNAGDMPSNETFDTFAEQATCFLSHETNYRSTSADKGIRFADRLSGRPVYEDLFDAPRQLGISSNMGMLVCGSSGGGKSMTVNHILRSLYDQGAHCLTVDIGGSYKGLCEITRGYYFTYEEKNPIRFNPFYLSEGEILDTEKKESLKSLLVALWKQDNEHVNRSEYVALSNAIKGYYLFLEKSLNIFPCFNTFYEYLQDTYVEVLKDHKVKERDFDVDNFLYVLRPYYLGGEFDYLLNATANLNLLQQRFIVFELDQIKDHPILFPVVTLIIVELFISKMRKLHGKRKVLIIDEAWKAIAKSGMAEFLRYAFKTIRKFNGIPGVITQELDDLVSSPIIKDAIINNADIKILMDMRKFMNKFDRLQETLGLSEKGKTILLSVNKENREIYVDIAGQIIKVFKNELCPEEYYAYTTEGKERVKVMEYAERHGSIEKGITALIADQKNI